MEKQLESDFGDLKDPRDMTPQQMVKEYQETSGGEHKPNTYLALIDEESAEVFSASVSSEDGYLLKELADLVYVTYGYAESRGWDLDMALLRVHENNMERMYQDDGTIQRRDDGKIIKNKNTPPVYLGDLV